MAHLSLEALRRVSLTVLRERAAAERALQEMEEESDESHDLGDEVVQMMKVECELYDAYTAALANSTIVYPSWGVLVAAAEAG